MNNIRFRFVRGEEVKYISHLDLMKVFERAARRVSLPVAYSQGFNPHPHIVFGLPLSVGLTSEAEYADFELTETLGLEEFKERLNNTLPQGLFVTDAAYRETKANIMANIARASYCILVSSGLKDGINSIEEKIREFLLNAKIIIKKESKSGSRDVDIRPMIYSMEVFEPAAGIDGPCSNGFILDYVHRLSEGVSGGESYSKENLRCLYAMLSAGSVANLKPDLLIEALNKLTGLEIKVLKIHRTGLYVEREGKICLPLDHNAL